MMRLILEQLQQQPISVFSGDNNSSLSYKFKLKGENHIDNKLPFAKSHHFFDRQSNKQHRYKLIKSES